MNDPFKEMKQAYQSGATIQFRHRENGYWTEWESVEFPIWTQRPEFEYRVMPGRRPHADLIVAWANGATIQRESRFQKVLDGKYVTEWLDDPDPRWSGNINYRIKPERKPDIVIDSWVYTWTDAEGMDQLEYSRGDMTNIGPNLQLTFDGETGELKAARLLTQGGDE